MIIELLIDTVDKTADIVVDSLTKQDIINEQKDTLRFQIQKYGDVGFVPVINQEVELNIDAVKEFGGIILEVNKSIQAGQMVIYDVVCCDYSQYINRELVLERYDDKTVDYIIDDIISTYAPTFTITNVDCSVEIETVVFNRMIMTECLDKLAKLVGYSWYIDYDKDVHFFERTVNTAPFEITDINGKYLQNTLSVKDDLSQIRNKVTIRGADERGIERTESYIADGDQVTFPLSNKFAEKPTVYVQDQAETTTVGVDFLSAEEDYDCFWNFDQKYIRFKDGTKPAIDKKVDVTGIPLFPIIVKIPEPVSIAKYGTYEHFKEDKSIQSRTEALKYAQAQLEAYKDGIIEGKFQTDSSGLRSGQLITIDSDLLNIDETFLIQSVQFKVLAKDKGLWSVRLATMRTVGIIQVLQDLIRFREIREFDPDNLLTLLQLADSCGATDEIGVPVVTTTKDYVWVDNGESNPIVWNCWTWGD